VSHGDQEPGEAELRVAAGGGGVLLSAWGPELFAENQRVLASFAEAAGTAGTALQGMRTALLAAAEHELRAYNIGQSRRREEGMKIATRSTLTVLGERRPRAGPSPSRAWRPKK